jgi:hypothetical protein
MPRNLQELLQLQQVLECVARPVYMDIIGDIAMMLAIMGLNSTRTEMPKLPKLSSQNNYNLLNILKILCIGAKL